jgi:hypothetical protein
VFMASLRRLPPHLRCFFVGFGLCGCRAAVLHRRDGGRMRPAVARHLWQVPRARDRHHQGVGLRPEEAATQGLA